MAEIGFSHRLTKYKIVGHFFGLSYQKISGSNQVKNRFFRISNISVPCPHAQLRDRTVIKKLWTFFGPWGRDRSQSPPCWIFQVKQIHPSTASERMTRQNLTIIGPKYWQIITHLVGLGLQDLFTLQVTLGLPHNIYQTRSHHPNKPKSP